MWHSLRNLSGFESKPHAVRSRWHGRTADRRATIKPRFEALRNRG